MNLRGPHQSIEQIIHEAARNKVSLADAIRQAHAFYDAHDGYRKGLKRMGELAHTEADRIQRNVMAQFSREFPERERILIVGAEGGLPGIAHKPAQWHEPSTWIMSRRNGPQWKEGNSALLYGAAGEGKSTAAVLLAYHEALAGRSVRYEDMYSTQWLGSQRFRDDQDADVLVLDESRLALEQGTWIQAAVKQLFKWRHRERRSTILIFTGEHQDFLKGFGPEIWDRFPPELIYPPAGQSQTALSARWKEGT
jgi:hypothetical protein